MHLCRMKVSGPRGTKDTVLMLPEQEVAAVTFSGDALLPAIRCGRARNLDGTTVTLADSVVAMDLKEPMVVDALADWLIEHPRIHLFIECPRQADAQAAVERLKQRGLRAERFRARGGTDISHPQIRLLP